MAQRAKLAALLCALAALSAVAQGGRPVVRLSRPDAASGAPAGAAPGRALLQNNSTKSCADAIPGCEACRYQKFGATVTRAVCTRCAVGYDVKNSGRDCWCAPGFFWNQTASDWECQPCGNNFYCPGSRVTQESGSERDSCGAHKVTSTAYARSDRECVVEPGYSWGPGDESVPCPIGTFNPGMNTRRCSVCPGGLTTAAEGSDSADACVAPPGYFYMRGRAVACWRGSYKETLGTESCDLCPEGFTTALNNTAPASRNDCEFVLPGYGAAPGAILGDTDAEKCPEDFYRSEDAQYDNTTGVPCTPCPANMKTLTIGQSSGSACMAPPGYGYNDTTGDAYECPLGTYNSGWNRLPCSDCGVGNITTDAPGAKTADDCMTPPGYRLYKSDGVYHAEMCETDFFGLPNKTYGLQTIRCLACPDFTTNYGPGGTDPAQCLTLPGYGFMNGGVAICEYGYWSAGNSRLLCQYCGDGYNTTAGGVAGGPAIKGATSAADCAVDLGHTLQPTGGVVECDQGFYKDTYGPAACTQCPGYTTTTKISGATRLSDCDACKPGHGVAPGGAIDPAAPACGICPTGQWGAGGKGSGHGAECSACPKPSHTFNGLMVSKPGATNPDSCFPEFTTDAVRNTSHLTWDFIPMDAAALSPVPAATSLSACQAACAASADCQYFQYDSVGAGAGGGPISPCLLRDKVPYSAVNVSDTSKSLVFFEIAARHYVVYEAHASDGASLGVPLATHASLADALGACNAEDACVGIKYVATEATNPWRTFKGATWEGVTAKPRGVGDNVDAWITGDNSVSMV